MSVSEFEFLPLMWFPTGSMSSIPTSPSSSIACSISGMSPGSWIQPALDDQDAARVAVGGDDPRLDVDLGAVLAADPDDVAFLPEFARG